MNLFKKTFIVFTLALTVLIGSTSVLAMETDNKVREMANETYVNRLTEESSFIDIILDIIGL